MTAIATSQSTVPPANRTFPGWPVFTAAQIDAVGSVLKSGKVNYWTGSVVKEFEKEYAAHLGVKHAVAVFNGTIALELIVRAMGIGPGDEVVVPPRTFVATATSVMWNGARPVFADIDPVSGNVTADTIRAVVTPRAKAVIVVHLAGWPCDMDPIMALAAEKNLKIIEDCAQSHGAEYHGRKTGAIGHAAALSFCQDKIITTGGEGGLIATNDNELWNRIWSLKDHGKSYDAVFNRQHPPGFRWLHEGLGTNGRMTEMQAAIGRDALKCLPDWLARRTENAQAYAQVLTGVPAVTLSQPPAGIRPAYYRYYAQLQRNRLPRDWTRDRIMNTVAAAGYPCFSGSCCEIYQEKAFEKLRPAHRLPAASAMSLDSLCFLTHPTLTPADCAEIAGAVRRLLEVLVR
ncbi:MAG: DegT/DnrJ/EryC1/StrS aminotransferase family protein [Opitutae bacterium]|nr:DegT/DnrJ/EryC1/StrS aminotransferase family protein [Opitutae bacterium]